jgi:hypothetical protein
VFINIPRLAAKEHTTIELMKIEFVVTTRSNDKVLMNKGGRILGTVNARG